MNNDRLSSQQPDDQTRQHQSKTSQPSKNPSRDSLHQTNKIMLLDHIEDITSSLPSPKYRSSRQLPPRDSTISDSNSKEIIKEGDAMVDRFLADDLMKLSVEDRNRVSEEINGVYCMASEHEETPEMIQSSLQKLAIELDAIPFKKKVAYQRSQSLSSSPSQSSSSSSRSADSSNSGSSSNKSSNNNNNEQINDNVCNTHPARTEEKIVLLNFGVKTAKASGEVVDIEKGVEVDNDMKKKLQPLKVTPPPKGKPTGIMLALARLIELESSMEYAYTKHMLLVNRRRELQHQQKVLETLPVGLDAIEKDLEKPRPAGDLYD